LRALALTRTSLANLSLRAGVATCTTVICVVLQVHTLSTTTVLARLTTLSFVASLCICALGPA
jgi:hypothetical protein